MAKSFLVPINMNGLEIQNFLAHNLATAPTGVKGKLYYNTGDNKLYYYNGSSWVALTANTNVAKTTTTPKMDGTAAIGSETKYAAGDHVHPTDTSRVPTSRTVNGKALSSNITIVASDIADVGHVGSNSTLADDINGIYDITDDLGSSAYKEYTNSVTSGSADLVTSGAVATAIAAVDAMRFKGTIGTGGTVTTLPTSGVKVGDTYRVITAGTYASQTCEVGDLIIATATTPTWTVAQTNIDGAITSISGTSPISVSGSGSSRTVSISAASTSAAGSMSAADKSKLDGIAAGAQVNPTFTAVTGKPTGNQTPGFGSTFTISQILQAASGQITATDRTVKIPNATATTSAAGLMSAADKTALNNLTSAPFVESAGDTLTAGQLSKTISLDSDQIPISLKAYDNSGNEVIVDVQKTESSSGNSFEVSIASAVSYNIILRYAYALDTSV